MAVDNYGDNEFRFGIKSVGLSTDHGGGKRRGRGGIRLIKGGISNNKRVVTDKERFKFADDEHGTDDQAAILDTITGEIRLVNSAALKQALDLLHDPPAGGGQ